MTCLIILIYDLKGVVMKNIGLIYATEGGNTENVCKRLVELLGDTNVDMIEVGNISKEEFESYGNLILASSTSGVGELQPDWDDLIDSFDDIDFSSKTIALIGLGDQDSYPDSFCGGISFFYEKLQDSNIIGQTSTEGYEFEESDSVVDGEFVGLVIDEVNQEELTDERLAKWSEQIKEGFKL